MEAPRRRRRKRGTGIPYQHHFFGQETAADVQPVNPVPGINNLKDLFDVLVKVWGADTAYPGTEWTPGNPSNGQCAVTAMIVKEIFGGQIVKQDFHYWNRIDGKNYDLTAEQLGYVDEQFYADGRVCNYKVGRSGHTLTRYTILKNRMMEALSE